MSDKNLTPSQFSIFKGKSAMRLQLLKPEAIEEKFRVGCIVLQMAPFKEERNGNRIFDWENQKTTVKLGVADLINLIYAIDTGTEVNLFHEFNDTTKNIAMKLNGDKGYFLTVNQSSKDKDKPKVNISIPISSPEVWSIGVMLKAALPLIHNWF